jgi:hypothetical protein
MLKVRIKVEEAADALRLADLRQIRAVVQAQAEKEKEVLEICRLQQLAALDTARMKLCAQAEVHQRAAVEALMRQKDAKIALLIKQQDQRIARMEEQLKEEESAVAGSDLVVAEAVKKVEAAEKKYEDLMLTHQRMLAVALPNYDPENAWL